LRIGESEIVIQNWLPRHGVWPQNKSLPQSEYCDLTNASISCHSKIWKYEWRANGTCSMLPPIDYFNLALKLDAKNFIKVILGTNGIKSGEQKIVHALQKHIGTNIEPQVTCNHQSKTYLLEIRICFDKGNHPNYTNRSTYSNCRSIVEYLI